MKQSDICTRQVDKKLYSERMWIYANWESQKALGCAHLFIFSEDAVVFV